MTRVIGVAVLVSVLGGCAMTQTYPRRTLRINWQRLVDEAGDMIEDKIWRAYGILKHARVLTSDEVMNLLSAVRLGHAMKIIDFLDISLVNEILLLSQPAHLQKYYGQEMDNNRRDFVRAQMVREKLRNSQQ